LWATFAAFGFASGLLHLLGSAGLHGPARLLLTPITPAALTLAAYLFHSRDPRFLLRFAGGLLAGAVAAALLVPMLYFLIGRRLPWGVQPAAMSLMAGVVLPALMAGGLAAAFPAYRRRRFWRQGALLIGPAVLVVAVLTLARARGLAVVGSLAVWTLAAAWIGRGLNALSGDR
jgi:hypothetical protein